MRDFNRLVSAYASSPGELEPADTWANHRGFHCQMLVEKPVVPVRRQMKLLLRNF